MMKILLVLIYSLVTCTNAEIAKLHDVVFVKRRIENESFACKVYIVNIKSAKGASMIKCQFECFYLGKFYWNFLLI